MVCAASTHDKEEALILDAFAALKKENSSAKLLIVPRHPERFDKVASLIETFAKKQKLSWHSYAKNQSLEDDIVLVDVLGALVTLYSISDIVILGGAFEPIGGHNAAEAAQFGCKIISGKYYFNQVDIFEAVEGIAIVEASGLLETLLHHALLSPSQLTHKSDIAPIIKSLQGVMPELLSI